MIKKNEKIFFLLILISSIYSQKLTFQTSLFSHLYNKPNQNLCISPLSIYQIMSLLSNGASGNTQKEIIQALIPDSKIDIKTQLKLNDVNSNILRLYDSNNKYVKIANAILTKVKIKSHFLKFCKRYNALIDSLKSVVQVNKWCSQKTNGKINHIIDEINEDTKMILLNAIYLKADWKYKFENKNSQKRQFKNSNNQIVEVDTMFQSFDNINYYENENIQMIELPYEDENLSMIIILPKKEKYSSSLDYMKKEKLDYTKLINKLTLTSDVHLYLPKFKLEYKDSLVNAFKKMKMKLAFSDNAEFPNLNESEPLKISQIIHKTFIQVDEKGTEAAAVTIIEMDEACILIDKEKKIKYMYVDHSFIYMIKDKRIKDTNGNNMMLFLGVVNNLA